MPTINSGDSYQRKAMMRVQKQQQVPPQVQQRRRKIPPIGTMKTETVIGETAKVEVQRRAHGQPVAERKIEHESAERIMRIVPARKPQHPLRHARRVQQQEYGQPAIGRRAVLPAPRKQHHAYYQPLHEEG
ncbi:hypothetical protein MUN82_05345 [Hymenobacter aerilatus]|uniref:Uncharacterized protein n=1 Tax=Hymenobacter aerilatus TaxID=2932251 RepID=A0A8T9T3K1_9BACT|nr:hypothetical protein [Hymenobacter aerilatus]UOR06519.1 hypothetical protein MUN82_05345 [Hymenobacter aerilatus]